ncbi:MAG: tRNA pseudouridine(55) synthase TruB, partial [Burkholderiaceae bacterium]|nr:tRNA pseudouridine(55) synthase TruB [Burkholderiaceae bacterium]
EAVLLLDKPAGITSNDALMQVRRLLNAAKAGHGGTLDPMATGLLPIALGEATKFLHDLLDADKTYEAEIRFGIATDTGDALGKEIGRGTSEVTWPDLEAALSAFRGPIEQVPPMYSALKRAGRPLYEYARAGQTLEREARPVTIHQLELLALAAGSARIRVTCSKGTYVRTLAEDIGRALGTVAHLSALRRTRVGTLEISAALRIDLPLQLGEVDPGLLAAARAAVRAALLPPDALVATLPPCVLDAVSAARFTHGQPVPCPDAAATLLPPGRVRVYRDEILLGVGRIDGAGIIAPERVVAVAGAIVV